MSFYVNNVDVTIVRLFDRGIGDSLICPSSDSDKYKKETQINKQSLRTKSSSSSSSWDKSSSSSSLWSKYSKTKKSRSYGWYGAKTADLNAINENNFGEINEYNKDLDQFRNIMYRDNLTDYNKDKI